MKAIFAIIVLLALTAIGSNVVAIREQQNKVLFTKKNVVVILPDNRSFTFKSGKIDITSNSITISSSEIQKTFDITEVKKIIIE